MGVVNGYPVAVQALSEDAEIATGGGRL